MKLWQKILQLRADVSDDDFNPETGTILLQNDSDGNGDYIKEWNHANTKPTQAELDSIE